jgi:hypothetical protein
MARDITKLHPKVQDLAVKLVDECKKKGLHIKITDCVRSMDEQNGINASRTNCKYPKSYHNWGLAFDFCRFEDVDKDGKISDDAYNQKGNFFFKVGQVGKSLGLCWGGDFKSLYDGPHFEYKGLGTRSQIQSKYGTPENFFKSWEIVKPIKTVTKDSPEEEIRWVQVKINKAMNGQSGYIQIEEDGKLGGQSKSAVRAFWTLQGWNKLGLDKGDRCGLKTINRLDGITK